MDSDEVAGGTADSMAERLRTELARSARIEDQTEEMLEVASIVQEAVAHLGLRPVVVGGLALATWAPNDYVTTDIDVVMPYVPAAEEVLADLGFTKDGRFRILAGRKIFFEAPESVLRPDPEDYEEVGLQSGRSVLVQSPEGVLLIRMQELEGIPASEVFEQCLYLLGTNVVNDEKLNALAEKHGLSALLEWLRGEARKVQDGGTLPESWEIAEAVKAI